MAALNGHAFSTFDHDRTGTGLVSDYGNSGGWWFTNATSIYLNGLYPPADSNDTGREYMTQNLFDGLNPLKSSRMLIRASTFISVWSSCLNPCANKGSCVFRHYENRSVCLCPTGTCGPRCQSRVGCDTTTTTTTTTTTPSPAVPSNKTDSGRTADEIFDSSTDEVTSHVSFAIAICIMSVIIGGVYLNACFKLRRAHLKRRRRLEARANKLREKIEKNKKKAEPAEEEEEEEEDDDEEEEEEEDGDEEEEQEHSVEEQVEQEVGPSVADIRNSIGSISPLFSADIKPKSPKEERADLKSTLKPKSPKEESADLKSTYKPKSPKEESADLKSTYKSKSPKEERADLKSTYKPKSPKEESANRKSPRKSRSKR